jgi:DNA-directed RNA polymerase subunit RPC12/RpoP
MWREPLDKYDLMDNMDILSQRELDLLDSPGVEPEIQSSASTEKLRRAAGAAASDERGESAEQSIGAQREEGTNGAAVSGDSLAEATAWNCPNCGAFLRLDIYNDSINVDVHCKDCGHRVFSVAAPR